MSAEAEFYQNQYGGKLKLGATPLEEFERSMLGPGGRYAIAASDIQMRCASEPNAARTLAEIGCGGGEFLQIMQKRAHFSRLIGFDIAAEGQAYSESQIEIRERDLNQDWDLENSSVDFLVAMMVIEHLFSPFHSFEQVARVLKPNGVAYINLPLVTGVRNRMRLLFGFLPETSVAYRNWQARRSWDGMHLHYFNLQSIRDLCRWSNLELIAIRGVGKFSGVKSMFPSLLASEVTFAVRRVN